MNNSKNKSLFWLIVSIIMVVFSVGILFFTATNSRCQIGPAMCSAKNWGAYIGFFLGAVALSQFFLMFFKKSQSRKTHIHSSNYGLLTFGILLIISGIILAIIGLTNRSLNPPGAAMTPGVAMIISAILMAIAGVVITCFGKYHTVKSKKHPEKENHPMLLVIFVIGIIIMLFFVFGH